MLGIPAARPAALRCLRLAVPRLRRSLRLSQRVTARTRGPGVFMPVAPCRPLTWRRQGLPGSCGTPVWTCSALRPRRDRPRHGRSSWRRRCCLPQPPLRRLPQSNHFGAYHAACPLAVYASQPRLPSDHARLASGCRPTLPGGIVYPLGSSVRFSDSCRTSLPRLCLAHGGVAAVYSAPFER